MNVKIEQMLDVNEGKIATVFGSLSEATAVGRAMRSRLPDWEGQPAARVDHRGFSDWQGPTHVPVDCRAFEMIDRLRFYC